jgi:hypothetical protein
VAGTPKCSNKHRRLDRMGEPPATKRGAIYRGAAVGDLVRLTKSPDLEPQVVFLGLPIPPLTDKDRREAEEDRPAKETAC